MRIAGSKLPALWRQVLLANCVLGLTGAVGAEGRTGFCSPVPNVLQLSAGSWRSTNPMHLYADGVRPEGSWFRIPRWAMPTPEPLETDRDSFTPATTTVAPCRIIFETAYSFVDQRDVKDSHSFPEALLRVGVTEGLEFRLGWNYDVGGASSGTAGGGVQERSAAENMLERASDLSYGFKFRVSEQDAALPRSAFIVQASTPTSGPNPDTQFVTTYVFGWELPREWLLDSALRYATASEEEDRYGIWAPSIVLKKNLGEHVNVHAEYFAFFSQDRAENFDRHFFSPGVHVLLTPDVELGVRVGWGLNDQAARFFSNVGLGWRF